MTLIRLIRRCTVAASLAFVAAVAAAQTRGAPEKFTAFAVNLDSSNPVTRPGAGVVEIVVERWSTDADRDRLMKALVEKGAGVRHRALPGGADAHHVRRAGAARVLEDRRREGQLRHVLRV